ncbi:MFS transporter [Enterobacter sp. Ap-1006]|uniref:MFS transporter n=1 Tax=Enterobacter sp. Ap-1006 TaxID=2608345 RepID=UPI00142074AF|nr:MFS transporter [Enterobacter sp. Ap-1006]NIF46258.1 MFS transporter [Enterobacter sp. Ap-1006]
MRGGIGERLRFVMAKSGKNARAWGVLGFLVILSALASMSRFLPGLVVDPIKSTLLLDDIAIGLLQGPIFAAFFLLGSLPIGWLADRYQKRVILFVGIVIWSAATLAFGLVSSFTGLLVARACLAIGQATLQPVGWSILSKMFPPHRLSLVLGILASGTQIGVASSFLLGGFFIAYASEGGAVFSLMPNIEPWQKVFLLTGLLGVVASIFTLFIPKNSTSSPVSHSPDVTHFRQFLAENRRFLLTHFVGFSLLASMIHGAAAWMPTWLMRTHGMAIHEAGMLMAFMQFPVCAAGLIFSGWWVDRAWLRGRRDAHLRHFFIVASVMAVLGGSAFLTGTSLLVPVVCYAAIQFIQPFSGVAGAALQIATPERYRGRISALFIMCYNAAGMAIGPGLVVIIQAYLFTNDLGSAIGVTYLLLGSLAAITLWHCRQHFARTVSRTAALASAQKQEST